MKALFIVSSPHEINLPPMSEIQYQEGGELKGGWWCVVEVPQEHTVIVCVDSIDEMLDQMAASDDYLYLEDVIDETA